MKDLLIGAADLYDWSKIKVWANSARECGFDGDIALLAYRVSDDVIQNANKLSIDVYQINHDSFGQAISHNDKGRDTQAHQLRFFHAWQFLSSDDTWKQYINVIITDVRDVYFQSNPTPFLREFGISNFEPQLRKIVASSEAMFYKDELWGADNMMNGFGPLVYQQAQDWKIYNVGVVAGGSYDMRALFLELYSMTTGRYIPSDQSAYNILVNQNLGTRFWEFSHETGWACQCGTTLDPTKAHYVQHLQEHQPLIENNIAYAMPSKTPYVILHQYDRVPELKQFIEAKYGKA